MTSDSLPGWVLVIPWDPLVVGGVSEVVINLAQGLKSDGKYNPVVLVAEWTAGSRPRLETRDGVQHFFFRLRPESHGALPWSLKHPLRLVLKWKERRTVLQLLQRLNAHVLNFHYPYENTLSFACNRVVHGHRVKVIFSLHGNDIVEPSLRSREGRDRFVQMLNRGDAVVAPSITFGRLVTEEIAPELREKIHVIHNGVSPEVIRDCESFDIQLPRRYILNVGTFARQKGQDFLIDAFSQVAGDYPDLHLVLVGRHGPAIDKLRQQIARLRLENRVRMMLDVPHVKIGQIFAAASIFCLPSIAEPFGIVLLEAGVFGLPVIASRTGGIQEIVRENIDGLLVKPGAPEELARAFRTVLDDPGRADLLAASLRDRVIAEFSWTRAVSRYLELASAC